MAFWDHHAQSRQENLLRDEVLLKRSELLRKECEGMIVHSSRAGQRMLDDDNSGLDHRVKEIQFVKSEMQRKMREVTAEIEELVTMQSRVIKARDSAKDALRVTMFCQEERMKRYFSERVQDDVDNELNKERIGIEGAICLLQNVDQQITEQLRLNRSAKFHLEEDLKWKHEAQSIDQSCSAMRNHHTTAPPSPNEAPPSAPVTPREWENSSNLIIEKMAHHENNSLSLRALVKSVLEQTAADIQKQLQSTTAALERNIKDMKFTKSQMESKLEEINSEILDQERMRENIQTEIAGNEHRLCLTHRRLEMRNQRPWTENCRDPVQLRLALGVQHIGDQIKSLEGASVKSKEQQSALHIRLVQLQESINHKADSIYIDEVICIQQRQSVLVPTV